MYDLWTARDTKVKLWHSRQKLATNHKSSIAVLSASNLRLKAYSFQITLNNNFAGLGFHHVGNKGTYVINHSFI